MATILITGGTGMIGSALANLLLQHGYEVIILTRERSLRQSTTKGLSYAAWDVEKQTIDINAVSSADYIVHLAGANVADKRWTNKRKKEIVDSRTQSSALLIKALQENTNHVKAIISASAIGWYGPDPSIPNAHPFTENAPANDDFLGDTCKQWEASISPALNLSKRLVLLRTGIVLGKKGGALEEFRKPLRFGIAAILSSGRQIISWIHIDDLCRMYLHAIENENMNGPYNAVAPAPVSNKNLTLQLAKAVRRKAFIPIHVPSFVLKLALGKMSIEVLKSTTVSAGKIKGAGFNFIYPTIEAALNEIVCK